MLLRNKRLRMLPPVNGMDNQSRVSMYTSQGEPGDIPNYLTEIGGSPRTGPPGPPVSRDFSQILYVVNMYTDLLSA